MEQRQHARTVTERELRDCYEHKLGKGRAFSECLKYAELKSDVDMWSLKAYYSRESWFLVLIVVAVPPPGYGLCRGLLAVSWWVWRGFQS